MRTTQYEIGNGEPVPPGIDEGTVFAVILDDTPVLILLPRFSLTRLDDNSTPHATDEFEDAVRAHGARPLIDLEFPGEPTPGWRASVDAGTARARITGPNSLGPVYDGRLDAHPSWHHRVNENRRLHHGLVVITGSAPPTPDAALDMIATGRASWVRTSLEPSRPLPETNR